MSDSKEIEIKKNGEVVGSKNDVAAFMEYLVRSNYIPIRSISLKGVTI